MCENSKEDSVLSTLTAYHDIARNTFKRPYLVKDETCVQFLAYVLDSKDPNVITVALQVLELLVEKPEHRVVIRKIFGVQQALEALLERKDLSNEIKESGNRVLSFIVSRHSRALQESQNIPSQRFTLGKSKTITLEIQGMVTPNDRRVCEAELININGVISLTSNPSKKRWILRTKKELDPQTLISALKSTRTMSVNRIFVKNDSGQEEMFFQRKHKGTAAEPPEDEESLLPAYFPENDDPSVSTGAVANIGNLRQAGNWLTTAASNFFTKSFYW